MEKTLNRDNRIKVDELSLDETIFSQANGVLGVRATFAEGYGNETDNPYALINGFYNLYPFHYEENSNHFPQMGQTIVKLPDATGIKLRANDININLNECRLIELKRSYHLDKGYVSRFAKYQSISGEIFDIYEERIVSQEVKGLLGIQLTISSTTYNGSLHLESQLRMPTIKSSKQHDPRVAQEKRHLEYMGIVDSNTIAKLKVKTNLSEKKLEVGIIHNAPFIYSSHEDYVVGHLDTNLTVGKPVVIEKFAYYDCELTNPQRMSFENALNSFQDFKALKDNQEEWAQKFTKDSYFEISDEQTNLALHYAMYQLYSSGGEHDEIQIAAKGISGDGYEGHFFWDTEIYMLPYFILNHPDKARKLLMFRYKHIEQAKIEAEHLGINRGIKIPWRTINGDETSPYYPAGSAQIHINSDIAYSIIAYYNMTHDLAFLIEAGFELLLESAVFILDYGQFYNGQFHLNTVTGPDEYTALVNDNYYTNAMAQYQFNNIIRFYDEFTNEMSEVLKKSGYDVSILKELKIAADKMSFKLVEGVIAQDDSFMQKRYLHLDAIPAEKHPMLLHFHPLYIYRHQVIKQADTVLAMVLLNHNKDESYQKTYQFYSERTTHDSSLSKCIYGIAAYGLNQIELANQYFKDTLYIDLNDEKNHSKHGLHMANIGGTYLLLIYGIFGIRFDKNLSIDPIRNLNFEEIKLNLKYRGSVLHLELNQKHLKLLSDFDCIVNVCGKERLLESTKLVLINLD